MPSYTADITHLCHNVAGQLRLHSQVELLNIWPDRVCRNRDHIEWKLHGRSAGVGITREVEFIWRLYNRSTAFQ